jgi:hypothetical protein
MIILFSGKILYPLLNYGKGTADYHSNIPKETAIRITRNISSGCELTL